MKLLSAPFYALFSKPFYREASQARLSKAFLYMLYLTVISTVLLTVKLLTFMPAADRFEVWFKHQMPVVTWTPGGISIDKTSPYTITYPALGPLVTFDTTKDTLTSQELDDIKGKQFIFVAKKQMYVFQEGRMETRVINLIPKERLKETSRVFDQAIIDKVYGTFKAVFFLMMPLILFAVFFFWHLFGTLLYSVVALLINLFRQTKLSYGALFVITAFARSAVVVFTWLQIFLGFPFPWIVAFLLTSGYLLFGVKMSEESTPFSGPVTGGNIP